MVQVPIEDLLKQCPSIYKLVVMAAKRAKELSEGSPKLVETDFKKVTSVALEEIRQGKVVYQPDKEKEAEGEGKAKKRHAKKESKKESKKKS